MLAVRRCRGVGSNDSYPTASPRYEGRVSRDTRPSVFMQRSWCIGCPPACHVGGPGSTPGERYFECGMRNSECGFENDIASFRIPPSEFRMWWGVAQRESRRLLTDRLQVRILPPQLETEGQANRRWHPSRKRATRKGLWVQLPPFPLGAGSRIEGRGAPRPCDSGIG